MRRKSGIIIKKPTNKGKGKVIHLQAYLAPEGSTRLRFRDFETVGISVKSLSQPQGQSAAGRMMSYFMFRPCKKKTVHSVCIHWQWRQWAIGRQEWIILFKYQTSGKRPSPFPNTFFLYKISVISLCIYHLSQMIFNKIKNSKFYLNILKRRRTLNRVKH